MTFRHDTACAVPQSRWRTPAIRAVGRSQALHNVRTRLDAWRAAVRHRDRLTSDSIGWQDADDEAREAAKAFHAEVAQASARYAEEEFQNEHAWSIESERSAVEASSGNH
jgi:hypothetical protein